MTEHEKGLILFTNHYPFSPGEEFVHAEVEILQKFFHIVIVPLSSEGSLLSVPSNTEVDFSLIQPIARLSKKRLSRGLLGLSNLRLKGERLCSFFSSKVFEVINYCAFAGVIHKWIRNLSVDRSKTILYSYWLNALAFGISLTKNEFPEFTAVSRAHRVDLYQYCSERYLPYRRHILIEMDKVFCISEDGKKYLGQEFPKFKHKIIVSRLGTRDHGLSEKPYDDFQIISCSSVSEVKRIDLIILGLES